MPHKYCRLILKAEDNYYLIPQALVLLNESKISDFLRHTFATFLCRYTSDLKAIQRIMGHENIAITLAIYADATEAGIFESMKALEKSFYLLESE